MPNSQTRSLQEYPLLFISFGLTSIILCTYFAVQEHELWLWGLAASTTFLIIVRIQQARRAPRKEIETLDL
jgi:hypothetical protein